MTTRCEGHVGLLDLAKTTTPLISKEIVQRVSLLHKQICYTCSRELVGCHAPATEMTHDDGASAVDDNRKMAVTASAAPLAPATAAADSDFVVAPSPAEQQQQQLGPNTPLLLPVHTTRCVRCHESPAAAASVSEEHHNNQAAQAAAAVAAQTTFSGEEKAATKPVAARRSTEEDEEEEHKHGPIGRAAAVATKMQEKQESAPLQPALAATVSSMIRVGKLTAAMALLTPEKPSELLIQPLSREQELALTRGAVAAARLQIAAASVSGDQESIKKELQKVYDPFYMLGSNDQHGNPPQHSLTELLAALPSALVLDELASSRRRKVQHGLMGWIVSRIRTTIYTSGDDHLVFRLDDYADQEVLIPAMQDLVEGVQKQQNGADAKFRIRVDKPDLVYTVYWGKLPPPPPAVL